MKDLLLLMYSNHAPSPAHVARLERLAHPLRVAVAASEREAVAAAPGARVIFGHRYLVQCLPHAGKLRWVQVSSGGFDHLPCADLLARNVLLTRTTFPSRYIARHAVTLAWTLVRRFPRCFDLQKAKRWDPDIPLIPYPRKALVLGMGEIGRAIARLLAQDGITVYGVARHNGGPARRACDRLITDGGWRKVLPGIDLCFLALPLDATTRNLFDESAVRRLPPRAVIVNVGRGGTLDLAAVTAALGEGRLAGAGLDVVGERAAPDGGDFWETPNLLVTPYIAARYPERAGQLERFFERQLARYRAGKTPLHVVAGPGGIHDH